jgi:hypothetical protein
MLGSPRPSGASLTGRWKTGTVFLTFIQIVGGEVARRQVPYRLQRYFQLLAITDS